MTYIKVRWLDAAEDEAIWWWHELDASRREQRKVVAFRDGHSERADALGGTAYCWLSHEVLPTLEEINAQDEFEGQEIQMDEFERAWEGAATPP